MAALSVGSVARSSGQPRSLAPELEGDRAAQIGVPERRGGACSRARSRRAGGASASGTSGTRKSAPIEARTAFGASGSAVPSPSTTCAGPSTSAERISVPTLPGSATPVQAQADERRRAARAETRQRGLRDDDGDAGVMCERRCPGEHVGLREQHLAARRLERALERRHAAVPVGDRHERDDARRERRLDEVLALDDEAPGLCATAPRRGARAARAAPGGAGCGACPRSFAIRPRRPRRARLSPGSRSPRRRRARARRCPRAPCGRA